MGSVYLSSFPITKGENMIRKDFRIILQKLFVRRDHKDRLFLRCFQDKKDLLELYNSIAGSHYTNAEELEITTLEDGIYMSMKNDISFIVSWDMCLFEHQSTFNPNMPLRGMLYFARLYETYVEQNQLNIYGHKKLLLPMPHFIVFYNGSASAQDVSYLKLSDLYRDNREEAYWKDYPIALECVAVMLNINYGHNEKLMDSCKMLHDYAYFVQMVKEEQAQGLNLEDAIHVAMDDCIKKDILADLLIKSRSEVYHMLLTEYDERKYKKLFYRDGVQDGLEQGITIGESRGAQIALINQVCIKLQKGKSILEIADALETDEEQIQRICEAAERVSPCYDAQTIYEHLNP